LYKSDSGEFNLKSARLRGVKIPEEPDDVVNKEYVDQCTAKITKELYKAMNAMHAQAITIAQNTLKAKLSETINHFENEFYTKAAVDKLLTSKKAP